MAVKTQTRCTAQRLTNAVTFIQKGLDTKMQDDQVTAIQFEDGSGNKFNYQVNGGHWQFVDLTLADACHYLD